MKGKLRRKYMALIIALSMVFATLLPDASMVAMAAGGAQKSASGRRVTMQSTKGNEGVEASILPSVAATENDPSESVDDFVSYVYTGAAIKPQVTLKDTTDPDGEKLLVQGSDYSVSYKNNKNAWLFYDEEGDGHTNKGHFTTSNPFNPGTNYLKSKDKELKKIPTVVIKFKGNYKGQRNLYFQITPVDVTDEDGTGTLSQDNAVAWTHDVGNSGKNAIVYVNGKKLKMAKDATKAGDFYVAAVDGGGSGIQLKGNYTGFLAAAEDASYDKNFKVKQKVTWSNGGFVPPSDLPVGTQLKAVYPYYVDESGNDGADGHRNYTGKFAYYEDGKGKVAQVAIDGAGAKLNKESFVTALKGASYDYIAAEITPVVNGNEVVEDGGVVGGKAIVNYENNVYPGKAKVLFTGIGPFAGQKATGSFTITAKGGAFVINGGNVQDTHFRYSGKYDNSEVIQSVTYQAKSFGPSNEAIEIKNLRKDIDYKVAFKLGSTKNAIGGEINATITGLGAFKGYKAGPVKVGTIVESEGAGMIALHPDVDKSKGKSPDAKNIKVFDIDGKALKKGEYQLKEGEELSSEVGYHQPLVTVTNSCYKDVELACGYTVYDNPENQIKKVAVHVGDPNTGLVNEKGGVFYTGSPVYFDGTPVIALDVTTKGGSTFTVGTSSLGYSNGRDDTTDGLFVDNFSYVNNVKAGSAKFTAYGTGKYFGQVKGSFKIVANNSLDGGSGLTPAEPTPDPTKDTYKVIVTKDGKEAPFELQVGDSAQLEASVTKNDKPYKLGKKDTIEFSSSKPDTASVNALGEVFAEKKGAATITATFKNNGTAIASGTINVNVKNNIYTLAIASGTDLNLNVGETSQIEATLSKNDLPMVGAQFGYASDNTDAVTVSDKGLISAVGKGKAVVTVSYETGEGLPVTAKINVTSTYKFVSKKLDVTPAEMAEKAQSTRTFTISENIAQTNTDVAGVEVASDGSKITLSSNKAGVTVITLSLKKDGASDGTAVITAVVSETGDITISSVKLYAEGEEVKYPVQLFRSENAGLVFEKEFDSVQPALTELMERKATGAFEVAIPAGTYKELLYYNGSATIILSGQGSKDNRGEDVVIAAANSGNEYSLKNYPTPELGNGNNCEATRSSFAIEGSASFVLENLTIHNTYKRPTGVTDAQAEALYFGSTGTVSAYNCSFKSHQDTMNTVGKAWFYNCYIEGDTDFTWMETTGLVALYENCTLKGIADENDKIEFAAPRASADAAIYNKGQVFFNCTFTEDNNPKENGKIYIARTPWSSGYINQVSVIGSSFVAGEGTGTTLIPWKGTGLTRAGVPRHYLGWKIDSATAQNIGYTSTLTDEETRDVLTADEVENEYKGRRGILNRVFVVSRLKYQRDDTNHFDVDSLIADRKWDVVEDNSKEILDGESEVTTVEYDLTKDLTEGTNADLTVNGFALEKDSKGNAYCWKASEAGSTIRIPVLDRCAVTVVGLNKGNGTIGSDVQGDDVYYSFNNGSTTKTIEKEYIYYDGTEGFVEIKTSGTAPSCIKKIIVQYDSTIAHVPVTEIKVSSAGDATSIKGKEGNTLAFAAAVSPMNASNKDYVWSLSEEDQAYASIDEISGVLSAKAVTEEHQITVICTARDVTKVVGTFALTVQVAASDEFSIQWLYDEASSSATEGVAKSSNEELATGEKLIPSDPEKTPTWLTAEPWAYNSGKISGNTDIKGALTLPIKGDGEPHTIPYDVMYLEFPVKAGNKPILITNIKASYGTHGGNLYFAQYSYKESADGEIIVLDQPDVTGMDEDAAKAKYNTKDKTESKPVLIPVDPGKTVYVRIALGNPDFSGVCNSSSAKNITIGTVTLSGCISPEPGKQYIYSVGDKYEKKHLITIPGDVTDPTDEQIATATTVLRSAAGKGEVTSGDGFFKVKFGQYNDHGVVLSDGEYVKITLLPGSKVRFENCKYGSDCNFTVTSDADKDFSDSFVLPGGNGADKYPEDLNSYTYTYTGKVLATLTFTKTSGTIYTHPITVTQGSLKNFVAQTTTVSGNVLNLDLTGATVVPDDSGVYTAELGKNDDGADAVVITSVKAGTGNIRVERDNGAKWATIAVTVNDAGEITTSVTEFKPVTAISFTSSNVENMTLSGNVGEKLSVVTAVTPDDATNSELTWVPADRTTASVNSLSEDTHTAEIELLKKGTTTVTVTSKSNPDVKQVLTVDAKVDDDPVKTISTNVLDAETVDLYNGKYGSEAAVGSTDWLYIPFTTVTDADKTDKNGRLSVSVTPASGVVTLSSNEAAIVNGSGVIGYKVVGTGEATITATYARATGTIPTLTHTVTGIVSQAAKDYSFVTSYDQGTLIPDDEVTFFGVKAVGLYSNGAGGYAWAKAATTVKIKVSHPSVIDVTGTYHGTYGNTFTVKNGSDTLVNGVEVKGSTENDSYSFLYTGTTEAELVLSWASQGYFSGITVTPYESASDPAFNNAVTGITVARKTGSGDLFKGNEYDYKATLNRTFLNGSEDSPALKWSITAKDGSSADIADGATFASDGSMTIASTTATEQTLSANKVVENGTLTVELVSDAEIKGSTGFKIVEPDLSEATFTYDFRKVTGLGQWDYINGTLQNEEGWKDYTLTTDAAGIKYHSTQYGAVTGDGYVTFNVPGPVDVTYTGSYAASPVITLVNEDGTALEAADYAGTLSTNKLTNATGDITVGYRGASAKTLRLNIKGDNSYFSKVVVSGYREATFTGFEAILTSTDYIGAGSGLGINEANRAKIVYSTTEGYTALWGADSGGTLKDGAYPGRLKWANNNGYDTQAIASSNPSLDVGNTVNYPYTTEGTNASYIGVDLKKLGLSIADDVTVSFSIKTNPSNNSKSSLGANADHYGYFYLVNSSRKILAKNTSTVIHHYNSSDTESKPAVANLVLSVNLKELNEDTDWIGFCYFREVGAGGAYVNKITVTSNN